jgi:small subunit ribosomal protein S1
VEIPEQVVSVNDEVMVKIIDIDLERRRISLSLKQANEGIDIAADDFDPALYGMTASYDEQGNYIYPEGFDPETQEWKPGYEAQQRAWEQQYAEAQARWEAHKRQVQEAEQADVDAAVAHASTAAYSAGGATEDTAPEGSLASDEALQALREKLTGGR